MNGFSSYKYPGERNDVSRNNKVFGLLMIIMQIVICFVYGFLIQIPLPTKKYSTMFNFLSLASVFINMLEFMLVLLGIWSQTQDLASVFRMGREWCGRQSGSRFWSLAWPSSGFSCLIFFGTKVEFFRKTRHSQKEYSITTSTYLTTNQIYTSQKMKSLLIYMIISSELSPKQSNAL